MRWPSYDSTFFLLESVDRYFMMLALMRDNRSKFIVPTYDIGRPAPALPRSYDKKAGCAPCRGVAKICYPSATVVAHDFPEAEIQAV